MTRITGSTPDTLVTLDSSTSPQRPWIKRKMMARNIPLSTILSNILQIQDAEQFAQFLFQAQSLSKEDRLQRYEQIEQRRTC